MSKGSTNDREEQWIEERHANFFGIRYHVKERLFAKQSKFQHVEIVDTLGHGKVLLNDGLVMISERDEFVYHDMIAHVPLFVHPNPKKVLVIGGGDGGTVREVLRHKSVETCYLVEIDEVVVNACREFIPQTSQALNDPRAEVRIEDGVRFVAETEEKFDLILVDSTDPIGPAEPLFGDDFYSNVKRVLSDDGIVISQGESPFYEVEAQQSMLGVLNRHFERVHIYNYTNLTYPGGLWSFTFASNSLCPLGNFNPQRVKDSGLTFDYYNVDVHRAAFVLPTFMQKQLEGLLTSFLVD